MGGITSSRRHAQWQQYIAIPLNLWFRTSCRLQLAYCFSTPICTMQQSSPLWQCSAHRLTIVASDGHGSLHMETSQTSMTITTKGSLATMATSASWMLCTELAQ